MDEEDEDEDDDADAAALCDSVRVEKMARTRRREVASGPVTVRII